MSVDRFGKSRYLGAVAISLLLSSFLSLVGCSNTNRGVTGSVGVGIGVALTTPGSVTTLLPATTLVVSASITNDTANGGVTWSIEGAGTLSNQTTTDVTYTSPAAGFDGEVSATITGTSASNPNFFSQVTLITFGNPKFDQTALFPANVGVAYSGSFSISGGTQPFTWALADGSTLPAGITLLGSTTGLNSISGTPTTAGSYTFTVLATDSNSLVVSQDITLTVNAAATCILTGTYSFMVSGFRGGGGMTHVANITLDAAGAITGEQDYKDGHRVTPHEILTSTSKCINRQTNSGQVTLDSASGSLLYNFSVTPPDSNGVIQAARLQLIGSGSDTASGLMTRVDPTTIPTTPLSGDFAFGLLGIANQEPNSVHFASAGRFTSDTSGNLSAGLTDSNLAPVQTAAALSGTISAPDANGRGTATFIVGSQTSAYVYYLTSFNSTLTKMFLMNIDPTIGSPRSSGFMTNQVGNAGVGTFDNTALASPSILTLWGAISGAEPITVQTMGRLSNDNATAATVDTLLDITDRTINLASQVVTGAPYTVDATSGRGTLSIVNAPAQTSYSLALYLDGVSNGYVVQTGATDGSGGLLEAQYVPAGGYPVTIPGFFVGGTQFAMAPGPITLNPLAAISFGNLSSNFTNGQFFIDVASGRGLGTLTQSGVGVQSAVLYIVSPTKIDVLRFSSRAVDGNVDWMTQD